MSKHPQVVDDPKGARLQMNHGEFHHWLADHQTKDTQKRHNKAHNRTQNAASRYRGYLARIYYVNPWTCPTDLRGNLHNLYGHDHYSDSAAINEVKEVLRAFARSFLDVYQGAEFWTTYTNFDEYVDNKDFTDWWDMADNLLKRFQHPDLQK